MKKILIIEDDKNKIEKLSIFFKNEQTTFKESFHGGVTELKNSIEKYDFLVLDMTIPLWEKGQNDLGGNYEQFGGEKVLREMKRRKLILPTILFTMFDVFPVKEANITFDEVNDIFKKEFSDFYIGAVYYNATDDNWKKELSNLMSKLDT